MSSRSAALVAACGLLAATVADAAPPTYAVTEALAVEPNRCFDAVTLAPVLAQWLQRDNVDRRLRVEIFGQPDSPQGITLHVLRDGAVVGERHFPGLKAPCDEVRAAVGLATAIAIDATILESLGIRSVPSAARPPPSAPEPPRSASRSWPRFHASLEGVGLLGILPEPAAAFAPSLGASLVPPLDLRLSALFSGAASLTIDGRSFDVALIAGRLDACAAVRWSLFRARGCAGFAAGRLLATSTPPSASVSQSVPWVAGIARADVRVSWLARFGLVVGVEAIVPLTRPTFEILGPAGATVAASNLPVVGAAISLGPEITFP